MTMPQEAGLEGAWHVMFYMVTRDSWKERLTQELDHRTRQVIVLFRCNEKCVDSWVCRQVGIEIRGQVCE